MKLLARGRTAEVYEWGEGKVLKLFNRGASASSVDFELKVSQVVSKFGGPEVFGTEIQDGRKGIVFEKITGNSMLEVLQQNPLKTWKLAKNMARIHAKLHKQLLEDGDIPPQKYKILRAVDSLNVSSEAKEKILVMRLKIAYFSPKSLSRIP